MSESSATSKSAATSSTTTAARPPPPPGQPAHCFLPGCILAATSRCGSCKIARYCSKAHQLEHWKEGHKGECSLAVDVKTAVQDDPRASGPVKEDAAVSATASKARHSVAGSEASAVPEPPGAYPAEKNIIVHADPSLDLFKEPTRADRKLRQGKLPELCRRPSYLLQMQHHCVVHRFGTFASALFPRL